MLCEICGKTIIGKPRRIVVERAKLMACVECAKDNVESWGEEIPRTTPSKTRKPKQTMKTNTGLDEEFLLVKNYGLMVKMAREKRSWSQEDLASKINEKASFIGKIETEKVVPSLTVIRKLEHILGINLTTKEALTVTLKHPQPKNKGLTIGDIMSSREYTTKGEESEGNSGRT